MQNLLDAGAPAPRPVALLTRQILSQVWKNKEIIPRIKTFAWRLLSKAIPSAVRISRFSRHIQQSCTRCGLPEDDFHLFFTCPFARAAWFLPPWFIRSDIFIQNCASFSQIIKNLLSLDHPYINLRNIFTFMWCLWKFRNDHLFNKEMLPYQVIIASNVLLQNLEMQDNDVITNPQLLRSSGNISNSQPQPSGSTVKSDFNVAGPKVYVDAAWKKGRNNPTSPAGIGIHCHWQEQDRRMDVFIHAKAHGVGSPISAEAHALLLAGDMAAKLQLQHPVFFTDNLSLARAAASPSLVHTSMLWEVRPLLATFQSLATPLGFKVYHISREINGVAHNCAHQAKRMFTSQPTFDCSNPAHSNTQCPVLAASSVLRTQGFVLLSVNCF